MPTINQESEMSQRSLARLHGPPSKFRLTDGVREQMLPSDSAPKRIFLLSPANIAGIRAGQVMSGHARSDLAIRLRDGGADRKSTRLNSSHVRISYAVFCLKKKK